MTGGDGTESKQPKQVEPVKFGGGGNNPLDPNYKVTRKNPLFENNTLNKPNKTKPEYLSAGNTRRYGNVEYNIPDSQRSYNLPTNIELPKTTNFFILRGSKPVKELTSNLAENNTNPAPKIKFNKNIKFTNKVKAFINNKTDGRFYKGSHKNLALKKRLMAVYPKGSPKVNPNNMLPKVSINKISNGSPKENTGEEEQQLYNNPEYEGLPPGYMDPREIRSGKLETTFGLKVDNKPVTVVTESNA